VRPERVLGSDPAPGEPATVDAAVRVLGSCVLALAQSRQHVERLITPDSLWQGPSAEPLVTTLGEFDARLRRLEDGVVELARALEAWRRGLAEREERVAELSESMSRLAGVADTDEQRAAIHAQAARIAVEHDSDAAVLVAATDALVEVLATGRDDADLAGDLDRALSGLAVAVTEWLREASSGLVATTEALADTAGLTLAVTQLVGVAGDGAAADAQGVVRVAAAGAGSHRLQRALRRSWEASAPRRLPRASFAGAKAVGDVLVDRLRGRPAPGGDA